MTGQAHDAPGAPPVPGGIGNGDVHPDGDTLGWELSNAVVMFHEAVGSRLGLSAADHKALGIVLREGPLTSGALAERTGLSGGAVTGLVDRLERAGHVERLADPRDRRRVLVQAVPRDRSELGPVFAALGERMGEAMAGYDEEQLAVIADFVRRTITVLTEQTRRLSGG